MTPPLSDKSERISPEDIALADFYFNIIRMTGWRTYAFNITSDTLPDREETQS